MAAGKHPFPFRTRQLSPPAPMVLGGQPPGRVGRRRIVLEGPLLPQGAFALQEERQFEEVTFETMASGGKVHPLSQTLVKSQLSLANQRSQP